MANGKILDTRKNKPEGDFYPTPPYVLERLLEREAFEGEIWENAAGKGHLSETLKAHGYKVFSSDKFDRGYKDAELLDFMETERKTDNIITNPPYDIALEFVHKSLQQAERKVCMLLRLNFLESKKRYKFFQEYPPSRIYIFSDRVTLYPDEVKSSKAHGSICYAWYVWEKGNKEKPVVDWLLKEGVQ